MVHHFFFALWGHLLLQRHTLPVTWFHKLFPSLVRDGCFELRWTDAMSFFFLFLRSQICPPHREAFQVGLENIARDTDLIFGNKLDQISVQYVARGENHTKRQVVQIFEVDAVCGAGRNKSEREAEMKDQRNT